MIRRINTGYDLNTWTISFMKSAFFSPNRHLDSWMGRIQGRTRRQMWKNNGKKGQWLTEEHCRPTPRPICDSPIQKVSRYFLNTCTTRLLTIPKTSSVLEPVSELCDRGRSELLCLLLKFELFSAKWGPISVSGLLSFWFRRGLLLNIEINRPSNWKMVILGRMAGTGVQDFWQIELDQSDL